MSPQGQIWALGLVAFSLIALEGNGSSVVGAFKKTAMRRPRHIVGKKENIYLPFSFSFKLAALV